MTPPPEDLVAMLTFVQVVEARSFSGAARTLQVSKSVVSRRVASLEQRLGVMLLLRDTRRLSLTAEGGRVYEQCARIARVAEDVGGRLAGSGDEPTGVLHISAPMTFHDALLADVVCEFVRLHPAVRCELSISDDLVNLIDRRVDLALRLSPSLADSALVVKRLGTGPKVLCAAPSYLRKHGEPRTTTDLLRHACLRATSLPQAAEYSFLPPHGPIQGRLQGPVASDSFAALRRAAVAGLGLAVMSRYYIADELREGRLVTVLDDCTLTPLGLFAVHMYTGAVPASVRAFLTQVTVALGSARWHAMNGTDWR